MKYLLILRSETIILFMQIIYLLKQLLVFLRVEL
nr:MAG TPA: hypothetical protein [Caudoviricetes sp.]